MMLFILAAVFVVFWLWRRGRKAAKRRDHAGAAVQYDSAASGGPGSGPRRRGKLRGSGGAL